MSDVVYVEGLIGSVFRDSKDPQGPWLRYTNAEFSAFLAAAKMGEFGHLV